MEVFNTDGHTNAFPSLHLFFLTLSPSSSQSCHLFFSLLFHIPSKFLPPLPVFNPFLFRSLNIPKFPSAPFLAFFIPSCSSFSLPFFSPSPSYPSLSFFPFFSQFSSLLPSLSNLQTGPNWEAEWGARP